MKRKPARAKLWVLAMLLFSVVCCAGETAATDPNSASLLPSPPAGWTAIGDMHFSALALSDYINGGAEAYHSYGFQEVAVRELQDSAGGRLTIEIYRMDRPENAFGIYTSDSRGESWNIGAGSSYGDGLLRFWKGPFFVRILMFPLAIGGEDDIRALGRAIADSIPLESKRPEILRVLPDEGVIPDSVCYFHRQTTLNNIHFLLEENVLHLGDEVEALTWRRKMPDADRAQARLVVVQYPSQAVAGAAMAEFVRKYLRQELPSGAMPEKLVAERPDGSVSGVSILSESIVIVLGGASKDFAENALTEVEKRIKLQP